MKQYLLGVSNLIRKENMMTTVAILGANGRLSNMTARTFQNAGYRVVAVTRNGKAKGLPADVEHRNADALDRQALIRATAGADIIFNGLNPLYPDWRRKVIPMGENVMAAARAHGSQHIFAGNLYNYGRSIPATIVDDTPFEDSTRKGAIRNRVEELFAREAASSNVRTIVLRAGDFYGGGVPGSWFDLMLASRLGKGRFTYPGSLDLVHSWAYLPDLARAFVALADRRDETSSYEAFLFHGHAMTGHDMKTHMEAAIGEELAIASVPWPLLRLGGLFSPMLREVIEMKYLWDRPHTLDGGKLEMLIGAEPHTRPQAAVAAALRDLGLLRTGGGSYPVAEAA